MQRDDVTREHVEQILAVRQRAKPALPWQMTSLIITATGCYRIGCCPPARTLFAACVQFVSQEKP